jgi:hypothetical protein
MFDIAQVNKANDAVSSDEYVVCLGYAGLVIKHLAATLPVQKWLGAARTRSVAIGFDAGDGIVLGSFTKKGWKLRTP